jgi:hypothetical protein
MKTSYWKSLLRVTFGDGSSGLRMIHLETTEKVPLFEKSKTTFYQSVACTGLEPSGNGMDETNLANAQRLAACWNACHGLDLPPDVPAGILAELVKATDDVLEQVSRTDAGQWRDVDFLKDYIGKVLAAILAKLQANVAPVSPPARPPDLVGHIVEAAHALVHAYEAQGQSGLAEARELKALLNDL